MNPTGLEELKGNANVRNYITVSRPTGQHDRQGTAPGIIDNITDVITHKNDKNEIRLIQHDFFAGDIPISHSAPPTTPLKGDLTPRGVLADRRLSKQSNPTVLPPINGASKDGSEEPPLPPHSPPGSSLRQTPPTQLKDLRTRPSTGASHVSAVSIPAV